jgi:glutamate/tyrosine decarboxylase-like PLP-dependent enzyme
MEIEADLTRLREHDADWRHGRVPLYVFGSIPEVAEVGREAFIEFFTENALGARRAFKSVARMEEDILGMALDLFDAPEEAIGVMTSGGTESIVLAVKACRDFARATRRQAGFRGNLVIPETAHPAFDKAACLMDLEVRRIPVGRDFRADVNGMTQAADSDTILIVGSAPCFPFGVFDPLAELSDVARSRGLWLHVDACVGGYLAPFARELGRPIPDFDFALPGVSSLSADLHKFGFCPKPASTLLFRDPERAEVAGFDLDVWPSGRFRTSTLVGTRPAGGVAAAWAVINFLGREGYQAIAQRLLAMRDAYVAGIEAIPGLRVFGAPELTILAFGREDIDMASVARFMEKRGWVPGMVRRPPGLHIMASLLHEGVREQYMSDLQAAVSSATVSKSDSVSATY